jgi:hypothetical protein
MNEPHFGVGLAIAGVLFAMPVIHALLVAFLSRWGSRIMWVGWVVGFVLFVAFAWPKSAGAGISPADTKMFRGLILGTGAATALAAWVVDRRARLQPASSTWQRAGLSVGTAVGAMVLVLMASC